MKYMAKVSGISPEQFSSLKAAREWIRTRSVPAGAHYVIERCEMFEQEQSEVEAGTLTGGKLLKYKMKFQRYMSSAFLNMQNVALYTCPSCAELRYEWHGGTESVRRFESCEAAESWYYALPGAGLDRLVNAINAMSED